jgi:hypothetical protein
MNVHPHWPKRRVDVLRLDAYIGSNAQVLSFGRARRLGWGGLAAVLKIKILTIFLKIDKKNIFLKKHLIKSYLIIYKPTIA